MAPKVKRAADGEAKAPKRTKAAKTVDPTIEMCGQVQEALGQATQLTESCREMLTSMVTLSLGTAKEERHTHQAEVVGMIEGALQGVRAGLEQKAAEAKGLVEGVGEEKAELEKARDDADAETAGKVEEIEAKQAALQEKKKALKEAEASRDAAQRAQAEALKAVESASGTKTKCQSALEDTVARVSNGTWEAESEAKQLTQALNDLGKELGFDASLLQGMPAAAGKKPAERGPFDSMLLQQFETQLQQTVERMDKTMADAEPTTKEHAGKVQTAQEALDAAVENEAVAAKAVTTAEEEAASSGAAAQAARKALQAIAPRLRKAQAASNAAVAELEVFEATVLETFGKLRDRSLVTAPEPEAPEPEAPQPEALVQAPEPEASL